MKYVSIDIETTGLDPATCQILEFGAVLDLCDGRPVHEQPTFHRYILNHRITGDPKALAMNAEIIRRIANLDPKYKFCAAGDLCEEFYRWLQMYGLLIYPSDKIVAAGKNFASFDLQFLKALPNWDIPIHHRCIDPGSLYFLPYQDAEVPSTKTCMERAGIEGEVAHTAVEDARVVLQLIRACPRHR